MEEDDFELTAEMKAILDERLQEDEETYLSAEESIKLLHEKYLQTNLNSPASSI